MINELFQEWPKIPRYRREMAVTEKLDGTSSCVAWVPIAIVEAVATQDEIDQTVIAVEDLIDQHGATLGPYCLFAQSRGRFITPARVKAKNDNYGLAQYVDDNREALKRLGQGYHYGEFWGYGIQRGYGMPKKR